MTDQQIEQECIRRFWLLQGDKPDDTFLTKGWIMGAKYMRDQIMQLIPRWKQFSQDCKPEVGQKFIQMLDGEINQLMEIWSDWHNQYWLPHLISVGYQFYIIPKS